MMIGNDDDRERCNPRGEMKKRNVRDKGEIRAKMTQIGKEETTDEGIR
jgi:hypothetical protein